MHELNHAGHTSHDMQEGHGSGDHAGHDKHAGHSVAMFRDRFWLSFLLPYSFCLPTAWTVGGVAHMDGSVDILMVDESGEAFGFGKAIGPIEPSGRLNPYKPFPENLLDPERQKRLLAAVGGVEPSSIEELSIQELSVDGNPGSLLTITIHAGVWNAGSSTCEWTLETTQALNCSSGSTNRA